MQEAEYLQEVGCCEKVDLQDPGTSQDDQPLEGIQPPTNQPPHNGQPLEGIQPPANQLLATKKDGQGVYWRNWKWRRLIHHPGLMGFYSISLLSLI